MNKLMTIILESISRGEERFKALQEIENLYISSTNFIGEGMNELNSNLIV
jgi:hypothetical protein